MLSLISCQPALAAGKGEGDALLAEANRLAARYSYLEAGKLFQKSLELQPKNAMAHHMYGRMLALQTMYDDALREYKISLKLKPNDPSVLNDVGVTLAICGFQPLAARFLHQASSIDQSYPASLNNLGVVLGSLNAFKQSRDAFARSLELQPRNGKIKELKVKSEARLQESKDFDFGAPVSWQDVPDSIKRTEPVVVASQSGPKSIKAAVKEKPAEVTVQKELNEADKKWLEKTQPLFLEMTASGFGSVCFSGNGIVQIGDKSDSADNIGQLELANNPKVELMGDVTVDLTGQGELVLGKWKVAAKDDECIFSVNSESGEIACYAGQFDVSNWTSVTASRTSAKVQLQAANCQSVYSQDDSKVEASNCDEVTLVGHSQGVLSACKKVLVNDDSRAVARDCAELTAMANSRVKASGCKKLEKLDHAKIETEH